MRLILVFDQYGEDNVTLFQFMDQDLSKFNDIYINEYVGGPNKEEIEKLQDELNELLYPEGLLRADNRLDFPLRVKTNDELVFVSCGIIT